jgi:hypothetical protein
VLCGIIGDIFPDVYFIRAKKWLIIAVTISNLVLK